MSDMKINSIQYDIPLGTYDAKPVVSEPRLNGLPYIHIFNYLALEDLFSLRLVRKMTAEESLYFASVFINRVRVHARVSCQLESYVQSQFFGKLQAIYLSDQICYYKGYNEISQLLNGLELGVIQTLFGSVRHLNLKNAHLAAETLERIFTVTKDLEVLELEDSRSISGALMSLDDESLVQSFASLNSVSLSASQITAEALQRFLRATSQLKFLDLSNCTLISPMFEELEQYELNQMFCSIETLYLGFTEISALALQKILLASVNLQKLVLWWCEELPECMALFSPEQFQRALDSVIDLDMSFINLPADNLYRYLTAPHQLKKLRLLGTEMRLDHVFALYDDEALRRIFESLEHFELTTSLTAHNLRRFLLLCHSLKSLTLTNAVHISEVVKSFTAEQMRQVFGSVVNLGLTKTNIKARALYKILLASKPLRDLSLVECVNISRTLSYLTQPQIQRIFGRIETLNISLTAIQRFQLERVLKSIRFIQQFYLSGCVHFIAILEQFSHKQLESIFYYLDDFKRENMKIPEPLFEKWMLATKRYRKYYN